MAELADAQDLKSCGTYTPVPVRFRSAAVMKSERNVEFTAFLLFFALKGLNVFEHLMKKSPAFEKQDDHLCSCRHSAGSEVWLLLHYAPLNN